MVAQKELSDVAIELSNESADVWWELKSKIRYASHLRIRCSKPLFQDLIPQGLRFFALAQ